MHQNSTLVVYNQQKLNVVSYPSFIYIFRNFKKSIKVRKMKGWRNNWRGQTGIGESGGISIFKVKDKNFV